MDVALDIVQTITDNLFSQVALLIGIIALIGLLLQRKPVEEVVAGSLRATIGVVILNIGIDIFVGGLLSFQAIVSSAVGLQPPTAASSLAEFTAGAGSVVPVIIAGGFVVHLLLVRIFPAARFVYLTGHLMYWMAVVIAASFVEAFGDVDRWTLAGVGAIVIGCYWVLQPLWTEPLMRKVMGDDSVGLAHTTSTLAVATGYGARALRLGDPVRHNAENLTLPKALSFFKDINVSTAFVIGVIMLVAIAFADPEVVSAQMGSSTVLPWVWGLLQALRFAAGIAILLFGVRMFLAEIVPAFKGLSEKALPGARPALDIPVTFTRAPTAVMVGFLTSSVVFLLLMGVFAAAGWFVLVPPMIMLFFGGGAGGVFGNAVAGWRGAVFGGVLNGILLAFGQWLSWQLYSGTAPELATLADPDWFAVGWLLIGAGALLSPLGAGAIWVIAGGVLAVTVVVLLVMGRTRTAPAATHVDEAAPVATSPVSGARATAMAGAAPGGAAPGAGARADRPSPMVVLAVCGAGMGSSLILRTTAEKVLREMGVEFTISHTDAGSARGMTADVVVAQPTYLDELGDLAPVMVPVTSFIDAAHVRTRLTEHLEEKGWL
ncbi:PTS transporter subunit IIC [Microbacterium sp.]|uniref:PTS transporter subunit IIC n=1 Tax=Microbacterium sp. TaxID=51671 RepID=UPI003A8A54F0